MSNIDIVRPALRHHRRPGRRVFAALSLLLLAGTLFAGIDAYGGKALSFGDGSDTDANKAMIQPLIDQLMKPVDAAKPFGPDAGLGLTQAEAEARVKLIHENVRKIVELAKLRSSEERAKFLGEQFKNGNVCVSWGMTARGTCCIDSATGKVASEKIAIAAAAVVGGALACHAPAIVTLAGTIAHENTHAGQSYAGEPPPNPTADQTKAAIGKKYACNEIEAHGNNETWKSAMAMALCNRDNLDPTKPIPAGTDPAIAAVLTSLRGIADAVARAAAAQTLKDAMTAEAAADKLATECYEQAKMAFMDFIAGAITKDELKAKLNDIKWKHYTDWLDDPAFVSEQVPSTITQSAGSGPGPDIHTGLTNINDFHVWPMSPSGNVLLVIGEDASGFGELQLYRDTNADQLFEESTLQVLFTGETQLQSNMSLFRDLDSGVLHVYDGLDRQIHRLADSDADDVPDQLGPPINPPDPRLEDYLSFEFAMEAPVPTILAYQAVDLMEPALPFDATTLRLRDMNTDGFFETVDELTNDQLFVWDPTFVADSFQHQQPGLAIFGPPGAQLQVWLTNDAGTLLQPRGNGIGQGLSTPTGVLLFPPFQFGQQMVIVDVTHDRRSPNALLSPWTDLGQAHLGSTGLPQLAATGTLSANAFGQLALTGAKPLAASALFIGDFPLNAPFKGGILVPAPVVAVPLPTSPLGTVTVPFNFPPGLPPGIPVFLQFWIQDAGADNGFAASNGLRGVTS